MRPPLAALIIHNKHIIVGSIVFLVGCFAVGRGYLRSKRIERGDEPTRFHQHRRGLYLKDYR